MGTHSQTARHGRAVGSDADATFFQTHGYTRVPRLVQALISLDCPLQCPHCLAAGDDSSPKTMPLPLLEKLIADVAGMGVGEFLLTGGEPLARREFPQIVERLRGAGVPWSLNTAAMPDAKCRAAMESYPPIYVAVSLDGPDEVHDRFRGRRGAQADALDSIAYFARLIPDGVAAGTTVTSRNFAHLAETFGIVVRSGASEWGLHLTVPEGRAAHRPELMLRPAQVRELLRFAASRRAHFPVNMADEMGYCGFWEALVRTQPFFCGAGRSHCVVLPDGEVVPCTTLDRTTSAGNIAERPLREIWADGFAAQRRWQPEKACKACRFASACEGGCWLQRRHGTQCFKPAWNLPPQVSRAAGVALAAAVLGFSSSQAAGEETAPEKSELAVEAVSGVGPGAGISGNVGALGPAAFTPDEEKSMVLERAILAYYESMDGNPAVLTSVLKPMEDDPGAKFVVNWAAGVRAQTWEELEHEIDSALTSRQHSLSLVCLCWRAVGEKCLDDAEPEKRSGAERAAIRATLKKLDETGQAWWKETLEKKLDPFLRSVKVATGAFGSKSSGGRSTRAWRPNLGKERFSAAAADQLGQVFRFGEGAALKYVEERAGAKAHAEAKMLQPFEVLVISAEEQRRAVSVLVMDQPYRITLESGEYTWGDVLRLTDEVHRPALEKLEAAQPSASALSPQPCPFLLPFWRAFLKQVPADDKGSATRSRKIAVLNCWFF
jgi:radical SAM protein with 4Fe4S-binding SPASM domain